MKELKSRKTGRVQTITDDDYKKLVELGLDKRYYIKEIKRVEIPKQVIIKKKNERRRKEDSE